MYEIALKSSTGGERGCLLCTVMETAKGIPYRLLSGRVAQL